MIKPIEPPGKEGFYWVRLAYLSGGTITHVTGWLLVAYEKHRVRDVRGIERVEHSYSRMDVDDVCSWLSDSVLVVAAIEEVYGEELVYG